LQDVQLEASAPQGSSQRQRVAVTVELSTTTFANPKHSPNLARVDSLRSPHLPAIVAISCDATVTSKTKLAPSLTALAMLVLTFAVPRGGALRDAQSVQFPVTVGELGWAIFVCRVV
jgi:hypothetical protein